MELNEIFALMERFDLSGLSALDLEWHSAHLRLEKNSAASPASAQAVSATAAPSALDVPVAPAVAAAPTPVPQAPAGESQTGAAFIKAPLVGTFYAAPAPDKAPFAPIGATVKKGQTVCMLEAMKMMSEIPAPFDCTIEEVLCADGELAGFDSPLFRVKRLSTVLD